MKTIHSAISISVLLLAAQRADALNEPDDPGDNQQQVRDAEAILPRVGTNQTPVMPTVALVSLAEQPGLTRGEDWLKVLHESLEQSIAPSSLAEGAFLLNRSGTIVKGPNELLIFVPDQTSKHPGEGPVLLMPCRTLEQFESEWTDQPVTVSGEIFDYHHRNQLLITAYRIGVAPPAQASDASTPKNPPSSGEDDPAVRDLLDELDQLELENAGAKGNPESIHRTLESPTNQAPSRSQVKLSDDASGPDEGTLILRRPARLIRNSNGAWTIVFDHDDADEPDATELVVEPCRMLMRMETIAMENGDAGQLLVSGRVYTYKGTHFILPTLIQRVRPKEINSLQ